MQTSDTRAISSHDSQILHPGTRTLYRYWESIRAERAAPNRDDIDLRQIVTVVPNLYIMDTPISSPLYKWRLVGTRIQQIFGQDLTHKDALLGWDAFERQTLRNLFDLTTQSLQPWIVRFQLTTQSGHKIGAEMIGLPLHARNTQEIQILGGVFPFRTPQDIAGDKIIDQTLISARTIWTDHLPGDRLVAHINQVPFRRFQVIEGGKKH